MVVDVHALGDLVKLPAAVFALGEHLRNGVDVIGIARIDRDVREVKRTLIDERVVADHRPMRAGVVGAPQNAALRLDQRKDAIRAARRDRQSDSAGIAARQSVAA